MPQGFAAKVEAFARKVDARLEEVVTLGGAEVHRSVVEGSEITGAPGQPILEGDLRRSFKAKRIGPLLWQVTTDLPYARKIEHGVAKGGPMTLRSAVGGFHSIGLTRFGWQKIVNAVVPRVVTK